MLPYEIAEKLVYIRQQELLAEAAAEHRLPSSPEEGVRRAVATALAALARRIDPAVWDGQLGKRPLPAGDAG